MEGLVAISGCEASRVGDVVFVHGLDGDARQTWHPRRRPDDFWPAWLGEDHPRLGVWTLGYAVSSSAWRGHSMPLVDRATQTLDLFDLDEIGARPVAFVCHSLGGLLIKQVLRTASESTNPRVRALAENTRAIMFLSTPHSGSDIANWIEHLGTLLRATVSVEELRAHDSRLRDLNMWYRDHVAELDIRTFVYCEKRKTKGVIVVNETSADPGIAGVRPVPLDEDHASICKPDSRRSQVYRRACRLLRDHLLDDDSTVAHGTGIGGSWHADVVRDGRPSYRIAIELDVVNASLFGTVRYPTGTAGIRDGVIDGDRVAFSTTHTPQFEDRPATIRFEGRIDGDEIRGVLQDDSGHGRVTARRPGPTSGTAETPDDRGNDVSPEARSWLDRGNFLFEINDLAGAIEAYDRALAEDDGIVAAWIKRGRALFDLGDLDAAIASHGEALERNDRSAEAYHYRSGALIAAGRLDEGISDCDRAIGIDPGNARHYYNRAAGRSAKGDDGGALEDLDRAISIDPTFSEAHNNRGNLYLARNRIQEALKDFDRALELDPKNAEAFVSRGAARSNAGRNDEAIADFEEALRLRPEYAHGHCCLANTYYNLRDNERAVAHYSRAIEIEPGVAEAYLHRSKALAKLGRVDEAERDYREAVRLDPAVGR